MSQSEGGLPTHWISYPLLLSAAAAAILFGMAAAAALGKWTAPSSTEAGVIPVATANPDAGLAHSTNAARARCPECGIIEAVRRIKTHQVRTGPGMTTVANADAKPPSATMNTEITIRMSDQSLRVIHDSRSADWRIGERVIVISSERP